MSKAKVFFNVTILTITIAFIAVFYQDQFNQSVESLKKIIWNNEDTTTTTKSSKKRDLFTSEQLAQHNGIEKESLYLSVLGVVFDVSKGKQHYQPGSSYYYFIAKDASRGFVSGNFNDDSSERDHVLDLSCDEMLMVVNWKNTFKSKYKSKGRLIGRYYNDEGSLTPYGQQVKEKLNQCKADKENGQQIKQQYPPCNSEWTATEGSRVWCSENSGGITRDWVGVPRQHIIPGQQTPSCVCVDLTKENPNAVFKPYDNCDPTSVSCHFGK